MYGIVSLMWLFQVVFPCFPGSLGYFFLPPCSNPETSKWTFFPGYFLRILIPTFTSWSIIHSLACVVLESTFFSAMHCFCLVGYLRLLRRNLETSPSFKGMRLYKEIYILVTHYNAIHGGVLTIAMTYIVTSIFITALYVCIGLNSKFVLPQLLLYAYLVLGTGINIVFCDGGIKASIYVVSSTVLDPAKQSPVFMRDPVMRRQVRSFPVLKILLGKVNFYDKMTPLTVMSFAIGQVVNLLLI